MISFSSAAVPVPTILIETENFYQFYIKMVHWRKKEKNLFDFSFSIPLSQVSGR
jgi:hypothetical protein